MPSKKLRDHKDMLQDVSLLQVRVNGLSGRLRQLTNGDAKMMMARLEYHRHLETE
ncbi:hypothetical protein [Pararhizobium qamdonense]|jgi:hypothetical protein|uniref:hypothetical protein n=1 Tax=Pararhizobium qamdonense TaxID=3031126 RepID=UPI0023E2B968|nr:hypothetical protein [Pararhizobium qamdonense]